MDYSKNLLPQLAYIRDNLQDEALSISAFNILGNLQTNFSLSKIE